MESIFADTDQAQYSDEASGHKPDGYPADIFSTLAANVANYSASPDSRKAIHARAIKACLSEAWASLAILENAFGDENTSDAPRFNEADLDVIPYLPTTKNRRTFLTRLGREKLAEFGITDEMSIENALAEVLV